MIRDYRITNKRYSKSPVRKGGNKTKKRPNKRRASFSSNGGQNWSKVDSKDANANSIANFASAESTEIGIITLQNPLVDSTTTTTPPPQSKIFFTCIN